VCEPIHVPAVVVALLLGIHVNASSVTFTFRGAPAAVHGGYVASPLAECGSGRRVPLRGMHFVVHFLPARTALSFAKSRRLKGVGAIRELAKTCDFESDLAWGIGLDRRRPYVIARKGSRVTVVFR
jgi:hypothetical protein